jgi:hypothetical protein
VRYILKNYNIYTNVTIVLKLVLFTELLVSCLVLGSSIAMASAGFSEENKLMSVSTKSQIYSQRIVNKN